MKLKSPILMGSSLLLTAVLTFVGCLFKFGPLKTTFGPAIKPSRQIPIGELGRPMGKRANVTGYFLKKLNDKECLMQITEINGRKVPRNITMPVPRFDLIPGVIYEFEGSELGSYKKNTVGVFYQPFFSVNKVLQTRPAEASDSRQ